MKKLKYKALISDVDGTLVVNRRDALPSPRVTTAVSNARTTLHVGVATSRPLRMMHGIFEHLQLSGPCIIGGGSQLYDATTQKIVWQQTIALQDCLAAIKTLRPFHIPIRINDGDQDLLYSPAYHPHQPLGVWVDHLDAELADAILAKIKPISGIVAHKILSHAAGKWSVDITHALATKQHGVMKVAELLGIQTHEIIGIGDSYNDFPLLMACGLKVAMGNAVPELKEIADYVAPTVDDDGVAMVIEKFVL